jgi:formate dehydrogenase major subunit
VYRLPTVCFAEDDGTFTNSGRVIAWKEKGADPPGDGKSDREIMARLFLELKDLYEKEGGAFADPIFKVNWSYSNKREPSSTEILKEISGYAISDVTDPTDKTKVLAKGGDQVAGFALLRDDGSTACGNWIYSGCFGPTGNLTARRDTADPSGLGVFPGWGFAWPANRRVLYNRASADPAGKPFDPKRALLYWNGTKWAGPDVPDMRPNAAPEEGVNPFIMCNEGVARLFSLGGMAEGPFPEHYEPFESPLERNPLHPDNPAAMNNPAARVFKQDWASFGKAKDFPYAATTYRVTEHFHFWTKHSHLNATTQPEQFVEISEELARDKGIGSGDKVVVSSNRGEITAKAVVTKRIKPLEVDGKVVHHVGIPIHWGFTGVAKKGHLVNTLTPFVGDANTQTPEYKSFLVDIEKA